MPALPITQWNEALDRMDAVLSSTLRALTRTEERWEMAIAPSAGEGEPPVALERLESRLREWETRLQSAEELTASVEREIASRVSAVERWRTLFAQWEELLKRKEQVFS
jgi:hypothetical protein